MAVLVPYPPIIEKVTSYVPTPQVDSAVWLAGKFMRFKIIADRRRPQFTNVDKDGPRGAYEHEATNKNGIWESKPHISQMIENGKNNLYITSEGYTHDPVKRHTTFDSEARYRRSQEDPNAGFDKISIIDVDYNGGALYTRKKYSSLTLPFVPRELNYSIASRFVGIATMGRNNPFYQFTGSEDKLEFEIDWFAEKESREDVIYNCRWLESLTKGDGYNSPPHRVILSWGSNNKLWQDSIWLVTGASYNLSNFTRGYRDPNTNNLVSTHLLPQQAKQSVRLVRLASSNRMTMDIEGNLQGY